MTGVSWFRGFDGWGGRAWVAAPPSKPGGEFPAANPTGKFRGGHFAAGVTADGLAGPPNPGSTTTAVQLLSAAGDQDGDGESNADEQAAGTNPLSAASVFRVTGVVRNGGNVEVSFSSVAGRSYQLETSATLLSGPWMDAGSAVEATGPATMISVPASGERRFYRVRVESDD